ncbi:MAG TPA: FAD-dependent oxidoreductase, partial [Longimicrobiales bacterium]|nr:FAD-dependent oxidoreductase [Longimicrobiales bacterium]
MHDIVVLGGGPGGYAAALHAHNFGLDVAMVDEERPGGTCLLRGCIPAKQWLQVAEVYSTVKHSTDFGVVAGEPELDWDAARERKNKTVEGLVRGLEGLLKQRKVELVPGYGRLDGPHAVVVDSEEGQRRVEGRAVIVATGSHPLSIPGYEVDGSRIVTSDHALDWSARPDRVAIVGGGVIGCEFASMLADFGSEVHVFEVMDQIVPGLDPSIARQLQRQLTRRGIRFHTGIGVEAPKLGPSTVVVPFGEESVEVEVVLMAVGRGPNTGDVGLESTRAELDRGFVVVDRATMQTADPGLYAVGDIVAGTPQLAHAGFAEAIAAVTHIATGRPAPVDYRAIPRVTYTHPEVAEVGFNEAQATEAGMEVETFTHGFGGVGRAIIIGQNQGTVKVVVEKGGPIVGASV